MNRRYCQRNTDDQQTGTSAEKSGRDHLSGIVRICVHPAKTSGHENQNQSADRQTHLARDASRPVRGEHNARNLNLGNCTAGNMSLRGRRSVAPHRWHGGRGDTGRRLLRGGEPGCRMESPLRYTRRLSRRSVRGIGRVGVPRSVGGDGTSLSAPINA